MIDLPVLIEQDESITTLAKQIYLRDERIKELKAENERLKLVEQEYQKALPFLAIHGWSGLHFENTYTAEAK